MSLLVSEPAPLVRGSADNLELHRRLAYHLRARLAPTLSLDDDTDPDAANDLHRFLSAEAQEVAELADEAPRDPAGFVAWFELLREVGPGQHDPLFPWLAEVADESDMRWFLKQELAGEAGFDDLVALTLVRMPPKPKMEMARNLWDEFGRGNPAGVHATLLARMAQDLELSCPIEEAVEEVLALANLMAGLAVDHCAFQATGALGVIELTAPGRVACVAAGMRRLGFPASARRYFELHATLDVEHSQRWNHEVLQPLVAANPRIASLLAQGALMRLKAGERCFARYRAVLGLR